MNQEQIKKYAKEQGYNYLGDHLMKIDEPLTDQEKIELGERQSNALCEINTLEKQKKETVSGFKAQIDEFMREAHHAAITLREGNKRVERELHCFFDPESEQRLFIDMETGEEVASHPAEKGDAQMRI